jgi:predicted ATPase/class 3 adenylate cyclase
MGDLPTGTVTFLFTDIEGSTRLLNELGDGYGELLGQHHRILREVLARHDGVEVGTEGDAFFMAFERVTDAVNAAARMQRALAEHRNRSGIDLWVRMGLHTGEAELVGDNYGGLDVHRAARISAAAHGGQVLLSAATAHGVQGSSRLDDGLRLLDLGRFRLKDLAEPEQLFQLCVEGLRTSFPPPAALGNPLHLPPQLDDFVERSREVRTIQTLLDERRLVTLTGPGGTGKTRLATEVGRLSADAFPDGVFFVELAAIFDFSLVPGTIAGALALREEGTRPIIETVTDYLAPKKILLILDNFEQVVEAAPRVSDLLRAAPDLKVVVTSRVSLLVGGEHEYPVPPMAMPDPHRLPALDALSEYESIDLFLQRARSVKPDFALTDDNAPVIVKICVRLDGLPLAIELAAARTRLLSPNEILTRLDQSLSLLSKPGRDVPQRQRTLIDAIGWSYDLLDPKLQTLFRRLGIFRGGWTLDDVEAVADPDGALGIDVIDGLETLIGSSLVRVMNADETQTRFVMLQTIREFALQALAEAGELPHLRMVHAGYYADLARRAEPEIFSDNQIWPDRLDLEHDNLRAALRRFVDADEVQEALAMATNLWRFWQIRAHLAEGRAWLTGLLDDPKTKGDPATRGSALIAVGGLTYWQNDFAATRIHYEVALDTFESIGDQRGVAEALYNLGFLTLIEGDTKGSRRIHDRSLAIYMDLDDELNSAFAKWGLAMSYVRDHEVNEAARLAQESLDTFERHRNWYGRLLGEFVILQIERIAGDYDKVLALTREMLGRPETHKDAVSMSSMLEVQANAEIAVGHPRRGLKLASVADRMRTVYGGGAPPPLLDLEDPRELVTGVLPEETIEDIWSEGQQMSIEETLAYSQKDGESDE